MRYVLQPCRLREDRFVPEKETDPITLDWRELTDKLAPSKRIEAFRALRFVQKGSYVGLLDQGPNRPPSNFCFMAQDRSGNIGALAKRNPGFLKRIVEVYRVLEADRGSAIIEADQTKG